MTVGYPNIISKSHHTVDEQNPAPPGMYNILINYQPQLMQDFFHQQFLNNLTYTILPAPGHIQRHTYYPKKKKTTTWRSLENHYFQGKFQVSYGNGMESLWEGGPTIGGPWRNPLLYFQYELHLQSGSMFQPAILVDRSDYPQKIR